ncbi:MAG: hypothetical protein IPL83_12420 [Bdellovibrionales bacterium]|nr:hypothetical protein [Bdellovibrionales bacterium]
MPIKRVFFLLSFLGVGQWASGLSNRMEDFSIHHCFANDCLTAQGARAFLNHSGLLISASDVTLIVQNLDQSQSSYNCTDFRADLINDLYICDNRADQRVSFTLDRELKMKTY